MHNQLIGKRGEKIAKEYLKKNGYKIITTNYYTKFGEIDIIAEEKDTLVFIEVKTRTNKKYGEAIEAINYKKQKSILKVAEYYISKHKMYDKNIRIDAVEVLISDKILVKLTKEII